jgi:exopolysaccharide production protein ExoQ
VFLLLDVIGRLYLRGGGARILGIWFGMLVVGSLAFFVANESMFLELLGKDPTLTGRTKFWPYVIDSILNRPFLGWGYFGFWTALNPRAMEISKAIVPEDTWVVWIIPNAHNGLLEALLEIGFVGTSFFVFLLLRNFVIALKCMRGPEAQLGLTLLMLLLGILIEGVSEIVLLVATQVWAGFFFTLGFMCEKRLRSAGRRKPIRWHEKARMLADGGIQSSQGFVSKPSTSVRPLPSQCK